MCIVTGDAKRARARRVRAATVIFQKICKGLYISHERGMALSHELTWHKAEGRKWILSWHETSGLGLFSPNKLSKKFDSVSDARAYANALLRG